AFLELATHTERHTIERSMEPATSQIGPALLPAKTLAPTIFSSNQVSFFFSSRRRHTRSVSAFLLNRSSDLNPNALRDYFRDIGRMVLAAEGRKANDSHADYYQYFCVPEYGRAECRLHFHAVHFMRTLLTGSVDPNFGRRVRNRRQLNSLQNTWPYGYSMPIAVRYTQDAFSRSGWLWPVDAKGEPLKATSYMAVGFYVAKYVNKKSDMDLAAKGLGAKEWNNSLKTKLSLLPKKLFRIR